MRQTLFLIIAAFAFASCNSNNNPSPSGGNNSNLNTAEAQLTGTWYLNKQVDTVVLNGVLDTSQTKVHLISNSAAYLNFMTEANTAFGPTAKRLVDGINIGVSSPTTIYFSAGLAVNQTNGWYIDGTTGRLVLAVTNFEIETQNSTTLILRWLNTTGSASNLYQTVHLHFNR